ncbi:hypothetical protein B0J13DRAFT_183980 [Dactylonectria estremocensis]|uniref:F-box domain-containing protein n=1 Tax=Dactylonectria estremocensis TaxID=1079267 RepID=A0A9P9FBY3_9HYPO|nr:hypothetical protein B0J13DRAFT_183980 [Dactylonectria estremocensis]
MAEGQHSCRRHFKRPRELLDAKALISCDLLRLPTEVLVRIFEQEDPIDGVCLALAYKHLVQVSAMLTIRVPSVAKHRGLLPSACDRIYDLLWRFEPQADCTNFREEKKKFRLCCDCLQYRPKKKLHWRQFSRQYRRRMGVIVESWKRAVDQWFGTSSAQCPECWCKERRNHYQCPAHSGHPLRQQGRLAAHHLEIRVLRSSCRRYLLPLADKARFISWEDFRARVLDDLRVAVSLSSLPLNPPYPNIIPPPNRSHAALRR